MQKLYSSISILIVLLTLESSCKSKKALNTSEAAEPAPGSWVMKYDRGPCFGYCPVYTLYLMSDHTGLLHVKANLMEAGWYAAALDQQELEKILTMLESDQYWHPKLEDEPEISDLPTHHLEYRHNTGLRTLDAHSRINHDLSDLFQKFNHLVTEARWETTTLRPVEEQTSPLDLIVQLKPDINAETWIRKYGMYGAVIKKKISPRQTYYLISKDPGKGSSNDLYQYLKRDTDVIGVQWDRSVEKRGDKP